MEEEKENITNQNNKPDEQSEETKVPDLGVEETTLVTEQVESAVPIEGQPQETEDEEAETDAPPKLTRGRSTLYLRLQAQISQNLKFHQYSHRSYIINKVR